MDISPEEQTELYKRATAAGRIAEEARETVNAVKRDARYAMLISAVALFIAVLALLR